MFGAAAILTLPLAAMAIDHPVDQAILGIPIPVPDARYFISGGLCAALSHGVTTPIDVVKTRIQSEPEVFNEGLLSATRAIVAQNGVGALIRWSWSNCSGVWSRGRNQVWTIRVTKARLCSILANRRRCGCLS